MSPPSSRGSRRESAASDTDDYLSKRARNNEAVKRSREKARARARETQQRVSKLKDENQRLETRIEQLAKELNFLKDVFLAHAGGNNKSDLDIEHLFNTRPQQSEEANIQGNSQASSDGNSVGSSQGNSDGNSDGNTQVGQDTVVDCDAHDCNGEQGPEASSDSSSWLLHQRLDG